MCCHKTKRVKEQEICKAFSIPTYQEVSRNVVEFGWTRDQEVGLEATSAYNYVFQYQQYEKR